MLMYIKFGDQSQNHAKLKSPPNVLHIQYVIVHSAKEVQTVICLCSSQHTTDNTYINKHLRNLYIGTHSYIWKLLYIYLM